LLSVPPPQSPCRHLLATATPLSSKCLSSISIGYHMTANKNITNNTQYWQILGNTQYQHHSNPIIHNIRPAINSNHRSTVDRIITLNTLLQTRREFNKPLWIAYVDLKSAFDSEDRESLWLILHRRGIPDKLVELMKDLYTDTCSCILADGMRSEWFQVLSGARQGCTVAPDLFLNTMDWILNRTVEQTSLGVSIGEESFWDLDYADDVTLLGEMLETLVAGLLVLHEESTLDSSHIGTYGIVTYISISVSTC